MSLWSLWLIRLSGLCGSIQTRQLQDDLRHSGIIFLAGACRHARADLLLRDREDRRGDLIVDERRRRDLQIFGEQFRLEPRLEVAVQNALAVDFEHAAGGEPTQ